MALRLKISKNPFNLSGSSNKIVEPLSDIPTSTPPTDQTSVSSELISNLAPENLLPPSPPMGTVNSLPFNINLSKNFYGYNGALEELDEEFTEFNLTKYTTKDFFNIFDRFFYQLDKDMLLTPMLGRSGNYIGGYINPRNIEIKNLQREIQKIKDEIDSIEKEHPYFKNGKVIALDSYKNNASAAVNESQIYYMQSAKRRLILDKDVYRGMKNRLGKPSAGNTDQTTDQDFIIFVKNLNAIPIGPPIHKFDDIYTPPQSDEDDEFGIGTNNITLYINRWPNNNINEEIVSGGYGNISLRD